jgi:hypothetical protein
MSVWIQNTGYANWSFTFAILQWISFIYDQKLIKGVLEKIHTFKYVGMFKWQVNTYITVCWIQHFIILTFNTKKVSVTISCYRMLINDIIKKYQY